MADEKKEGFWSAMGNMFQDKDKKKKKDMTDKIKDATKAKNDQLNDLYTWQSGK